MHLTEGKTTKNNTNDEIAVYASFSPHRINQFLKQ